MWIERVVIRPLLYIYVLVSGGLQKITWMKRGAYCLLYEFLEGLRKFILIMHSMRTF